MPAAWLGRGRWGSVGEPGRTIAAGADARASDHVGLGVGVSRGREPPRIGRPTVPSTWPWCGNRAGPVMCTVPMLGPPGWSSPVVPGAVVDEQLRGDECGQGLVAVGFAATTRQQGRPGTCNHRHRALTDTHHRVRESARFEHLASRAINRYRSDRSGAHVQINTRALSETLGPPTTVG